MKKLILLTLPFFLFACNSVEKFKAPIEELATKWGETTNQVTEFANSLNGMMMGANNKLGEFSFSEEEMAKMGEDELAKYTGARTAVMNAIGGFAPIQNELGEAMKTWTEKTDVLQGLQEGLAAGELGPDTMDKISDLNSTVSSVTEMLTSWKSKAETQQAGVNSMMEQLSMVYTTLTEK